MPTSRSRLIPMDVAARVVSRPVAVPRLSDPPFAASGTLERGIHIHWALPDSMTRAQSSDQHPPRFRGVPDLWLVIRFNPVVGNGPRTYRAWVIDAMTGTATRLPDWQPPAARAADRIHTAMGVLRRVKAGWGEWDNAVPFNALTSAYYPECRGRLGFHDDLSDLAATTTGKVSYTVIGWYSQAIFDPFQNDGIRRRDKMGHRPELRTHKTMSTAISKAGRETDFSWTAVAQRGAVTQVSPVEARVFDAAAKLDASTMKSRVNMVDRLVAVVPVDAASSAHAVVDSLLPASMAFATVCHGSVMDVPIREARLIGISQLDADAVALYPNVQRAMAEVASQMPDSEQADWLDMMLGQLGQQSGTVAGVIDLPGAQHARTFQGVPGPSQYYARLDIRPPLPVKIAAISVADLTGDATVATSGHWPPVQGRSLASSKKSYVQNIPAGVLNQPPAAPAGPTEAEIVAWIQLLRTHFATARQQATAAGKTIDPRVVRVQDYRRKAQPTSQGRMLGLAGSGGSDGAGWWIDLGDPSTPIDITGNPQHAVLAELRRSIGGARVHMPDAKNLFEVPGARWYRPWAPHLVVYGGKRSYRHGFDGRFREDGHLATRVNGESLSGLRVGAATVLAKDIVAPTTDLAAPGLPNVAASLVHEHVLADSENAPLMARQARTATGARMTTAQMVAATRALWLPRGDVLSPQQQAAINAVAPIGRPSSAAGLQLWRDWYGPLFLDLRYTHRLKRFNAAWQLPPEYVETVDRDPVVAPEGEQIITERQAASVSVVKVLQKTLVTEMTIDPYGKPVKKHVPPPGVDAGTFDQMDLISAPLAGMDDALSNAGVRERGGFVHMNQVRLFDTFGATVSWASNDATLAPPPAWATALPARLSDWGRLNFRLQSAANAAADATPLTPPVCGILLPDFVDQSLEVYDADGRAIGQLTTDDPFRDNPGSTPRTLSVQFTLLPWVAATLAPGSDPLLAISNLTLRRLVQSLVAQSWTAAPGAPGWHESGLTAMMRVFDTVRSTLDPAFRTSDHRVRLLGEPILVMNLRLHFEASHSTAAGLRTSPVLLTDPPALPVLRVRVGDVTRPDDGVLGCFLPGTTPAQDRFAPVSRQAAEEAVLNQMIFQAGAQKTQAIAHPFIAGQVAEFDLAANAPLGTIVLADARGALYATCGLLPRKSIVIPHDFIQPALERLEPSFAVGPVLGFEVQGSLTPVVPAPRIEGLEAEFVRDDGASYPEMPLPPTPAVSELPNGRVRLTSGWVRMSRTQG